MLQSRQLLTNLSNGLHPNCTDHLGLLEFGHHSFNHTFLGTHLKI